MSKKREVWGITMAILATLIWSGNFIVARGVADKIPPVSLAFFRWACATVILIPFVWKQFHSMKKLFIENWRYLLWTSLFGITLFNTLVYVAAHYSPAINLALIGTTSSPVFSIVLAAIFLGERIWLKRVLGIIICLAGIVMLLAQGSWQKFVHIKFSEGDWWVLIAAIFFATYNVLVKVKPREIPPLQFLFITFAFGTLLLFPGYLWERREAIDIEWNMDLILIVGYLGIGASVICFILWNEAIARLGASTTALFGNLIPVFSIIEAILILDEQFTTLHLVSGLLVISGLMIANWRNPTAVAAQTTGKGNGEWGKGKGEK